MNCPCGTPGFDRPKDLAAHLNVTHLGGHAVPRALRLAWAIAEGKDLAPEDLVVISGDRVPSTRGLSRQAAREDRQVVADAGIPDDAKLNTAIAAATFEAPVPTPVAKLRKTPKPAVAVTAPVTPPAASTTAVEPTTPPEERPMATKEKVCKLCVRKAPKKCKRHGGAAGTSDNKPTEGGRDRATTKRRGRKPEPAAVASPNGHAAAAAPAAIDEARSIVRARLLGEKADLEANLRFINRLLQEAGA